MPAKTPPRAGQRKKVGYAYPSSDFAERLGFGKTGCWYVGTDHPDVPAPTAQAGFPSFEEAFASAVDIDLPWSPWTMPAPVVA